MTTIVKLMQTQPQVSLSEEEQQIWNQMVNYLQNKPQLQSAAQTIDLIDEAYTAVTHLNTEQTLLEDNNLNANKWHNDIAKSLIQKYYLTNF